MKHIKIFEDFLNETGEPDQDYNHEFYDSIVKQLEKAGFPGAMHREFDKYQGVYLTVPKVGKFWSKDFYVTGDTEHLLLIKEGDKDSEIDVTSEGEKVDASELIEYCKTNKK